MRILLFLLLPVWSVTARAQLINTFSSTPDSAIVSLNDKERCRTPCSVDLKWSEGNGGPMIFSVSLPGYETWTDTLKKKPNELDEFVHVKLKRSFPRVAASETYPTIAFDKIICRLKAGETVGSKTTKDGDTSKVIWQDNELISPGAMESRFHQIVADVGLRTPFSSEEQLFQLDDRVKMPRYLIGVDLETYREDLHRRAGNSWGAGKVIVRSEAITNWQVYDVRKERVVWLFPSRV